MRSLIGVGIGWNVAGAVGADLVGWGECRAEMGVEFG